MRKKYSYFEKYSKKVEQCLIDRGIQYKILGDDNLIPKMISFVVYDAPKDFDRIVHGKPIVTNEFTKKELQSAEYLTVRPKKNVVDILNVSEAFVFKCGKRSLTGLTKYEHKEQIRELTVKPIDTSGKTCFFASATGFSEMFVKKDLCEVIRREEIKGIVLRPVKAERNGKSCDSGLFQLCSDKVIKRENLYFDEKQKRIKCSVCGFQKIVCGQDYQLRLNGSPTDLSDDFYMTEAIFGEGISYPLFVMSHKFYDILVRNCMISNVIFEPVTFTVR